MPTLASKIPFFHERDYEHVVERPQDDEKSDEALLGDSNSSSLGEYLPWCREKAQHMKRWLIAANIALFCLSSLLLFLSGFHARQPTDKFNNTLIRQTSEHSPILDQVHIPLTTVRRNGSFVSRDPPSIYRQDPSPEVDTAWRRLSNINTIPLSSADVVKLGIDPSTTAKFPAHFGFGDDAHIGRLDVFHQIHCLNSLRKEINFDYYFGDKFPDGTRTPSHKSHISHCLEILLEAFMCNANIEPILHYWVDIAEEPFPDFDNNHQCRDFDTVLKWHEEHSVGMSYFRRTMRRPDNVIPRKMSHKYKVLIGVEEDDITSGFP